MRRYIFWKRKKKRIKKKAKKKKERKNVSAIDKVNDRKREKPEKIYLLEKKERKIEENLENEDFFRRYIFWKRKKERKKNM